MTDRETFDRWHADCEAPYECLSCGRPVCIRCDPSPQEPSFCAECTFFGVDGKGNE